VRWQLNWPLVRATLLVVVILAPAAYLWHAYQLKRNSTQFLARADELEQQSRWRDAMTYIERYLQLHPDDVAARVRLARVFDRIADASPAKIPASERLFSIAVGLAPEEPGLRLRHAHRLAYLGRYDDALDEVNESLRLLEGDADADALQLRAVAGYGDARARGDFSTADKLIGNFRTAIAALTGSAEHVDLAMQLAELYRHDLKEPEADARRAEADKVVDDMVAANAQRPAAWIARYLYHERHDGAGADTDLDRALELDAEVDAQQAPLAGATPSSAAAASAPLASWGKGGRASAAVKGLMARLLVGRGHPGDRERGRQILEDLATSDRGSDSDRIALVSFYRSQGDLAKAQEHAFALANRKNTQPLHIARYVDLLLRGGRAAEAEEWLDKLSSADPHGFSTLNLRVRLLAARDQRDAIVPLVDEFVARRSSEIATESGNAQLRMAIGRLYAQVGMADEAGRTFRQLEAQSPGSYQPLALWLAGHDQPAEAIDICVRACDTDSTPQAAATLVRSLIIANAGPQLAERVEPVLTSAAWKHAKDAEFLLMLATWRLAQQHNDEAIGLLRRVLAIQPRSTLAMNNLADALAERAETRAEARDLIDRALAQAGPLAELLDTKGTLVLLDGDAEGAVKLFRDATSRSVSDPRHLFHLALALRRAGNIAESRDALRRANKQALSAAILSPQQRRMLIELERDLQG
jgi:tetratricopeptide (TPR) repeat protein